MNSISVVHWFIVLTILFSPYIIGFAVMGPQQSVRLKHPQSGLVENGYIGFCWTFPLIGFWVPIVRGEIRIGLLHIILSMITLGLSSIVMGFIYNKQHTTRLLNKGWILDDAEEMNALAKIKLGIHY